MRDRPAWARKTWMWLTDGQYDLLVDWKVPDDNWAWKISDAIQWAGVKVLCAVFRHKPIADQCGMPEHDFCVFCNKPTPLMASRQL